MDDPRLQRIALLVPIFLLSLCIHEFAHGWVAYLRGDDTAKQSGRLTLNPIAHADLFGTLIIPLFCLYYNLFFIGWAKPVPVDPRNMKYGIKDMSLVAAAGPISNILIALLATGALALSFHLPLSVDTLRLVQLIGVTTIQINLMLAVFNLIPCPPLDGFRIIQAFLPLGFLIRFQRMENAIGVAFMLLIYFLPGGFQIISVPVQYAFRTMISWI